MKEMNVKMRFTVVLHVVKKNLYRVSTKLQSVLKIVCTLSHLGFLFCSNIRNQREVLPLPQLYLYKARVCMNGS